MVKMVNTLKLTMGFEQDSGYWQVLKHRLELNYRALFFIEAPESLGALSI